MPSMSVPSEKYSHRRFTARQNIFYYSPPLQGIVVKHPHHLQVHTVILISFTTRQSQRVGRPVRARINL